MTDSVKFAKCVSYVQLLVQAIWSYTVMLDDDKADIGREILIEFAKKPKDCL